MLFLSFCTDTLQLPFAETMASWYSGDHGGDGIFSYFGVYRTAMNPLQTRLAALRRRLRLVITFRGLCWAFSLLVLTMVVGGLLDWRVHLPSLVRAFLLVGTLCGTVYVAYRYLIRPLMAPADDLSLALQVESRYPILNDALASAVQFMTEPSDSDRSGSPEMRKLAVNRALDKARRCDFNPVVDTRGVGLAGLSVTAAGALALAVCMAWPQLAWTGLRRLASPFGGHEWPKQTHLDVASKTRIARGEAFAIRGTVKGFIPERATVEYRFEGAPALEQAYEVTHADPATGSLLARLDPARVQRNFRYQVRANDASSEWIDVVVLPPPQLTQLNGQPSPQVEVSFPGYTDLPAQKLPDGATSLEVAAGAHIRLRAAVDRPVVKAWLEYPQDQLEPVAAAASLVNITVPNLNGVLQLSAAPQGVWKRIPARLNADGTVLALDFIARISGTFALGFEDEIGLGNTRLIELRTVLDPPPVVNLERPSRTHDTLDILPDAEITLQVLADDSLYALRSVYLEYRVRRSDQALSDPVRMPLFDHEVLGRSLPSLLTPLATMGPPHRLRPQRLDMGRRWSLKELKLQEGDALLIQAGADDFDDVTVLKKPGLSNEVELRVVGRSALESILNDAQAQIQQELLRLQKQQQEAIDKVIPAETQARTNPREPLRQDQLDQLLQAEQLQQQIRARVGNQQEGLRSEVSRVLQTLRDNQLPRSGTQDRMEAVSTELGRLAREELEQIEPRLTEARKENEQSSQRSQRQEDRNNENAQSQQGQQQAQPQQQQGQQSQQPQSQIGQQSQSQQKGTQQQQQGQQAQQKGGQSQEQKGQQGQQSQPKGAQSEQQQGKQGQQSQQQGSQSQQQQGQQAQQKGAQSQQQKGQPGQQSQQKGGQSQQQKGQQGQQSQQKGTQSEQQQGQQGQQSQQQGSQSQQQQGQQGQQSQQKTGQSQQQKGQQGQQSQPKGAQGQQQQGQQGQQSQQQQSQGQQGQQSQPQQGQQGQEPQQQQQTQQPQQPLTEARKHQEEVDKTLRDLLKLMEPWSSTREIKGEARSILQEQRKLGDDTKKLAEQVPVGENPQNLTPSQRSELERAADQQNKLSERTGQLLDKLERLAQERKAQEQESAQALEDAAKRGKETGASSRMQEAERNLRQNQLGQAGREQQAGAKAMEEVVKALEDRREEELDRLSKKMKEAEQRLADLSERQEQLMRQARDAEQISDPQKREEALKRLGREQEELQRELQEMVRELSRMRADRAGQRLSQAGSQMQRASRQMQRGERSNEQQDEALDRLNDAQRELAQSREDVEEELERERRAKIADQIKALKDRQESLLAEQMRIHREVMEKAGWSRELGSSSTGLSDAQKGLSEETQLMAKEKLEGAKVFSHLLSKSGESMLHASDRMLERLEAARKRLDETPGDAKATLDPNAETFAEEEIEGLQKAAMRRIDQLLEAFKPDPNSGRRRDNQREQQGGEGGGEGGGGGGRRRNDDGQNIPDLAQLKALKALQIDVNERTKAFDKKHPDVSKLSDKEKEQLKKVRTEQQEVRDLFHDLTAPEGGKR